MTPEYLGGTTLFPQKEGRVLATVRPYIGLMNWYHTVALAIALGILFTNLPIYTYILRPDLLPKFFFFGLFFLLAPILLMKFRMLGTYLMSPFAIWALVLITLNLIHLSSFSVDSDANVTSFINAQLENRSALILTRIQYVVFALLFGFAVYASEKISYLRVFIILAIVIPCAILLDFVSPGLLYPIDTNGAVLGRAAAMFINPTMAAEAALLIFLFACTIVKAQHRVPLFLLLGAGILVTFTRSAIIALVLLLPMLVYRRILPRTTIIASAIAIVVGLVFFGNFENYLGSRQEFDGALENVQARLNFFSDAKLTDDSSLERAAVVKAGLELFLQNPVFGAGAGATQFWSLRASTHNQLLLQAVEYGLLGIVLWLWLAIILWNGRFFQNRGLQLAIVFLYVFMSMFTHQMLDSASYWLATFALVSVRRDAAAVRGMEAA
jgi:O-antigen ligase